MAIKIFINLNNELINNFDNHLSSSSNIESLISLRIPLEAFLSLLINDPIFFAVEGKFLDPKKTKYVISMKHISEKPRFKKYKYIEQKKLCYFLHL